MKTNATLIPITRRLESLFETLNKKYFGGELPHPVITIQPYGKTRCKGWCTNKKVWQDTQDENESYYEINICAEYLGETKNDICTTMLHEMCHLYALENDLKDTSRKGAYHNEVYKGIAEAHGLICDIMEPYGWAKTTPTEETEKYFDTLADVVSTVVRKDIPHRKIESKQSSTRKYICPICENIIRATKEVNVICADCEIKYELQ